LRHRLQVGLHDTFDPVDLGEVAQFGHGDLAAAPGIFQRLQRHVQADLVAELEAVGHRLGGAVDADGCAVVGHGLDAVAVRGAAQARDAQRGVAQRRGLTCLQAAQSTLRGAVACRSRGIAAHSAGTARPWARAGRPRSASGAR
jgi:hypothetical protein